MAINLQLPTTHPLSRPSGAQKDYLLCNSGRLANKKAIVIIKII